MAPFSATPESPRFSDEERGLMLSAAIDSIEHGLHRGTAFPVRPKNFPSVLQSDGASFVTIQVDGNLRGCIGTLNAYRSLIIDIVENAFSASRNDTRFPPICFEDLPMMDVHLSILSEPEPMDVLDEEDFIRQLRPGIDGAILQTGSKRGTFLPSVWEHCSDAHDFVRALKRKAGIAADDWPADLQVFRYVVETVP